MKHLARIALIVSVLIGVGISGLAQNSNSAPPPKRKFRHTSKVEVSYDKAKNGTMVYLRLMNVGDLFIEDPSFPNAPVLLSGGIRMSAYYTYPGKTPVTPQWVTLGFVLGYPDLQNLSDYSLVIKIDDQVMSLGQMSRKTTQASKSGPEYVTVEASLPYDKFLQLANARKVEARVGIINFDLTENHLEAIRDLASRTGPSSQTAKDDGDDAEQQKRTEKADADENGELRGKAISLPKPEVPPVAKAARAYGVVTVLATVNENGDVIAARVLSGHPLLHQAALDSARRAKFSPSKHKGQPVKVVGIISYNFVP